MYLYIIEVLLLGRKDLSRLTSYSDFSDTIFFGTFLLSPSKVDGEYGESCTFSAEYASS